MHLIYLPELKVISGYKDFRSVKMWLASMNISLIRIGKNYAVNKDTFEKAIAKQYTITKQSAGYQPKQKAEKEFLAELQNFLNGATVTNR